MSWPHESAQRELRAQRALAALSRCGRRGEWPESDRAVSTEAHDASQRSRLECIACVVEPAQLHQHLTVGRDVRHARVPPLVFAERTCPGVAAVREACEGAHARSLAQHVSGRRSGIVPDLGHRLR